MKKLYHILLTLILLSVAGLAHAQSGVYIWDAINGGTYGSCGGGNFSDTRNNSSSNGFINFIGQPSPEIYYTFTLTSTATVSISHCGSGLSDTYMHLLDAYGNEITSDDDNGPLCSGLAASIQISLAAGTYYIASEGYGYNTGNITTSISVSASGGGSPAGAYFSNAIDAGTLTSGTAFSSTLTNSACYGNEYGQPSNDIFYKFTLSGSGVVNLSHCGSAIDTYIHLLDASGNQLAYNDDNGPLCAGLTASIQTTLNAGTYYVVSEGWNYSTGSITTGISVVYNSNKEVDVSFNNRVNFIFGALETNRVPYGLLSDYAMEFTGLSGYNGTALADSNLVNKGAFFDIYKTLVSAGVHSSALATLPDPQYVDSTWYTKRQPGRITLGGLFYQYAAISPDVESTGKLTAANGQYHDVYSGGVWQNPYVENSVVAFSPSIDSYKGKSFDIYLTDSLWFSNSKSLVNHIEVDAGDGQGYRTITLGSPLPVSYADTGVVVWNFKLYLNNSTVLLSHARLHVLQSPVPQLNQGNLQTNSVGQCIGCDPSLYHFFTSTETFDGLNARAAVNIQFRAGGNGFIHKPLIVVEGFDAGIYSDPESITGMYSIKDFLQSTQSSGTLYNLIYSDYDVIFIDFKNGTDDIRRNALVVKDIIRWVNTVKQGTEPNVVLGLSMGGLVARYALKKMENAGETHQVRLFINHDGPMQGANVPLAAQYLENSIRNSYERVGLDGLYRFVRFFSPSLPNIDGVVSLTDAPASKQMLINHVADNFTIDNSTHTAWQTELTNLGYPANCRNIAISNGSECGNDQVIAPGGLLLNAQGKVKPPAFAAFGMGYYSLLTNQSGLWIGVLPGSSRFNVDFQMNATAENGGNLVYHGKLSYTKKLFWLINITTDLTNRTFYAPSGSYPYDSFGGGSFTVPTLGNIEGLNITTAPSFNFVPTTSALDIGSNPANLAESDYRVSYVGSSPPASPKNTPFANFITAYNRGGVNEQHITYETRNGNWLAAELNGQTATASCSALCQISGITGDDFICDTKPFSVPGISGASYAWSVSPGLQITSGQGTATVQVAYANGAYNSGTVTCQITYGDCGMATFTKNINLGVIPYYPPGSFPIYSGGAYLVGETQSFGMPSFPGALSYHWVFTGPGNITVSENGNTASAVFDQAGTYYVYVYVTTQCGIVPLGNDQRSIDIYDGSSYYAFSPNPASSQLVISNNSATETGKKTNHKPYEVKLYDSKGKIWRNKKNTNGEAQIVLDINDMPNNTYYLHIIEGKKVIEKQILIHH